MSSLKPQLLPYTKKTISASVSGIGAKVGQSVSGLWSSLSSGIASSLLNRSLGLTNEDVARMEVPSPSKQAAHSVGAGTNISAGGVVPSSERSDTNEKMKRLAEDTTRADRDGSKESAPALIDDEIETLFAGFQKRRKSNQGVEQDFAEAEERGKKLKMEEAKVRALNQNGRVDYSIQEYVCYLIQCTGQPAGANRVIGACWTLTLLSIVPLISQMTRTKKSTARLRAT